MHPTFLILVTLVGGRRKEKTFPHQNQNTKIKMQKYFQCKPDGFCILSQKISFALFIFLLLGIAAVFHFVFNFLRLGIVVVQFFTFRNCDNLILLNFLPLGIAAVQFLTFRNCGGYFCLQCHTFRNCGGSIFHFQELWRLFFLLLGIVII